MAIQEIAAALTSDEIISGVLSVAITLGVIAIFKVHAEYIIYFIFGNRVGDRFYYHGD